MELTSVMQRCILHWGEMGNRWGVNRSVAQIHALLYLSPQPLNAEEIAATLSIARSNVSNSLKELQNWQLVHVSHVLGDRRDHFLAEKGMWELLLTVMDGRKRREIDPTLSVLRQCVTDLDDDRQTPKEVRERIKGLLQFTEQVSSWYEDMKRIPRPTLVKLMKMGTRVAKLVGA